MKKIVTILLCLAGSANLFAASDIVTSPNPPDTTQTIQDNSEPTSPQLPDANNADVIPDKPVSKTQNLDNLKREVESTKAPADQKETIQTQQIDKSILAKETSLTQELTSNTKQPEPFQAHTETVVHPVFRNQTQLKPFYRPWYVLGRGVINVVSLPLEIPRTAISLSQDQPKMWPITFIPHAVSNLIFRASSALNDIILFPFRAAFVDDLTPWTRGMGLPDYPWQKD